MQIAAQYSHLNGHEYLLVHHPELWEEMQAAIEVRGCRLVPDQSLQRKTYGRQAVAFSDRHEPRLQSGVSEQGLERTAAKFLGNR